MFRVLFKFEYGDKYVEIERYDSKGKRVSTARRWADGDGFKPKMSIDETDIFERATFAEQHNISDIWAFARDTEGLLVRIGHMILPKCVADAAVVAMDTEFVDPTGAIEEMTVLVYEIDCTVSP